MATMLAYHKQIDKRTTMKNQNRSAAFGRPAIKLLVGGGGFNKPIVHGPPVFAVEAKP